MSNERFRNERHPERVFLWLKIRSLHSHHILFVVMPVDPADMQIGERVAKQIAVLTAKGVPVVEKLIWPKHISPLFFTERIPCMSDEMSEKIYWTYKAAGWPGSDDYLTRSPSTEDWESVLWQAKVLPVVEVPCPARRVGAGIG